MSNSQLQLLITGGTGYIGSNLIDFINTHFKDSYCITVIDRTLKKENIQNTKNIEFKEADLSNKSNLNQDLEKTIQNSDILIHSIYLGENEQAFLDFVLNSNPQIKLIYLSSAAVYGENDKVNIETSELKPINDYGRAKLEIEEYIKKNFSSYLIFRISNPYGKEKSIKGFHKIIQAKFEQGERKVSLNADHAGQIIRDFVYIDDLCKEIMTLIKSSNNEIFNISSGKGISLEEFSYQIADDLNIAREEIEFIYNGCKAEEIKYSILDNNKALSILKESIQKFSDARLASPEGPEFTKT